MTTSAGQWPTSRVVHSGTPTLRDSHSSLPGHRAYPSPGDAPLAAPLVAECGSCAIGGALSTYRGRAGGTSGVYLRLAGFLGGVTGRLLPMPAYWYLGFFSDGFRIWKEHMRVSSTDIMPPALSNSPQ